MVDGSAPNYFCNKVNGNQNSRLVSSFYWDLYTIRDGVGDLCINDKSPVIIGIPTSLMEIKVEETFRLPIVVEDVNRFSSVRLIASNTPSNAAFEKPAPTMSELKRKSKILNPVNIIAITQVASIHAPEREEITQGLGYIHGRHGVRNAMTITNT